MSKSLNVCQCLSTAAKSSRILATKSSRQLFDVKCKRGLRSWKKALPFPPNFVFGDYIDGHHVFYPPLKNYLREKNALENPVKLVDIGLNEGSEKLVRKQIRSKAKEINDEELDEDKILSLLQTKPKLEEFNYENYSQQWLLSDDGQKQIIDLAHHYGIFRDLFSSPSHIPVEEKIPEIKPFDFYPRSDETLVNIAGDWHPGAKRIKNPDPKPLYYFSPVAPVYAEFVIAENEIIPEDHEAIDQLRDNHVEPTKSKDNLEVSVVHRGNIIRPQFARYKPNVVIDARRIGNGNTEQENDLINVEQTGIQIVGDENNYYTLSLLNLDSQFGDEKPICHWQVANIKYDPKSQTKGEETVSYLPVYGIRGLGYHRYVFFVCRHEKPVQLPKVDDFELKKRFFDPFAFIQQQNATPVGLSWFQTTYDYWCHHLFHNVLNMRAPTYEWIQPEFRVMEQLHYPEKTAFNLYLDYYRDPKEINKYTLMERLKSIHPFEYHKQIEPRKLPPNIYKYDLQMSWQRSILWKKANRFAEFRNLRPSSALQPLNNNSDLDKPFWPPAKIAEIPLRWPRFKKWTTPLRDSRWSLPIQEHPPQQVFGEDMRASREQEEKEEREARKHIKG